MRVKILVNRLREIRELKGLTPRQLSERAGMHKNNIYKIESKVEVATVNEKSLRSICAVLDCMPDYLKGSNVTSTINQTGCTPIDEDDINRDALIDIIRQMPDSKAVLLLEVAKVVNECPSINLRSLETLVLEFLSMAITVLQTPRCVNDDIKSRETIGYRVKNLRRIKQLTQKNIAEGADISTKTVSNIEKNKSYNVSEKTLMGLCTALNCTEEYLRGWSYEPNDSQRDEYGSVWLICDMLTTLIFISEVQRMLVCCTHDSISYKNISMCNIILNMLAKAVGINTKLCSSITLEYIEACGAISFSSTYATNENVTKYAMGVNAKMVLSDLIRELPLTEIIALYNDLKDCIDNANYNKYNPDIMNGYQS